MQFRELVVGEFEQIQVIRDVGAGVLAFIVVHDTRLGPAFGGIRRWDYRSPEEALADALRLAEAMTWKAAISGVPGGGAKSVIFQHPEANREAAYRLIGRHVHSMGGRYFTGPDVGTEAADLNVIAEETEFVARPDVVGSLADPTALGVFAGLRAVAQRLGFDSVEGVRVVVQGLGEVGMRLAEMLHAGGARLTVCDVVPENCERAAETLGADVVDPGGVLGVEADIWAPCALGGVVHDLSLQHLKCRAIAGSANNVLASPDHGRQLFERGVLYAPDFVINSGALVHGALYHLEGAAPPPSRIEEIGTLVGEILDASRESGEPPEQIAARRARERVHAAPPTPWFPGRS